MFFASTLAAEHGENNKSERNIAAVSALLTPQALPL
jgi:hypothetical protein